MKPVGNDEVPLGGDETRIGRGKKALAILVIGSLTLATLAVCLTLVLPLMLSETTGENRSDEEMIAYFHEHEGEFTQLIEEYGLPEQPDSRWRLGSAEPLGIIEVNWSAPGAILNWYDGPGSETFHVARGLWLYTWVKTGLEHAHKGYVYTEDPLAPLADDLSRLFFGHRDDISVGICFRDIGGGWYLFRAVSAN